jgi:hypothetical protein
LFVCVNKKPRPDQADQGSEPRRRSQTPRKVHRCFRPWGSMGHNAGMINAPNFKLAPRQARRGTFYVLGKQQIWQPDSGSGRGVTVLGGYEYNSPEVSLFERFAFFGSGLWTSALSCGVSKTKSALKLHTDGSVRL